MYDAIETVMHRGIKVEIFPDESPSSPREWDNLGVMVCSHRRYSLGDKQVSELRNGDFDGWDDIAAYLRKEEEAEIILPIFMLDHSSVTLSAGAEYTGERPHDPFSHLYMGFDSGQVGFIYATRKAILENFMVKRLTAAVRKHAVQVLTSEVKEYGQYVNGDVYGYVTTDPDDEDNSDSCWGFIGDTDAALAEGKHAADYMADERDKKNAQLNAEMTLVAAAGMH